MVSLARVVVAAPGSGQGKTTIATGLMAALRAAGHVVSGHKVGPDYIDPGYHGLACGRPGRNLDPHLVGEHLITPLLLHGAAGADLAVIEGVMGLYDGRLGTAGFASTAHVATLTRSPVILVLDVAGASRTAAAIAAGMLAFEPSPSIAGVVLNRARPGRNTDDIVAAIQGLGLPVLGCVPHDDDVGTPSRHLGLITAAERADAADVVRRLGVHVGAHVDLEAVVTLARSAPDLPGPAWNPADALRSLEPEARRQSASSQSDHRPVIAVADGPAFTFRYRETEELLRAAGCEPVGFDPLTATELPPHTRGIYLGGGFPEVHAGRLSANRPMREAIRRAMNDGVPTVAECAGLLYLAHSIDGMPMVGALPVTAQMSPRLTLRYPEAVSPGHTLLTRPGEQVTGHEFHRTCTDPAAHGTGAWIVDDVPTGFADHAVHASYLHVHWAGYPQLAHRFARAAQGSPTPQRSSSASSVSI